MATSYSPGTVTDGLILALDAANTKSYPGVQTYIYDLSQQGNDGVLINSPTINNSFSNGGQLTYTLVDWSGGHPTTESGLDAVFNQGSPVTGVHSTALAWGSGGQAIRWGGNVGGYPSYHNKRDYYGWKVEGYIFMPETGTYSFLVDGDDAIDFFIGGHKCSYWYGGHGFGTGATGTSKHFNRGWYPFIARMEEQGGGDGIAVGWRKPSDSSYSTIPIENCATSVPTSNSLRNIQFDGTNDYIEIPHSSLIAPSTGVITTEVWFKAIATGTQNGSILINKENEYEISAGGGYISYAFRPNWAWVGATAFSTNQWYCVTITYDQSFQRMYVNGSQVYSASLTGAIGNVYSNALRIGARGAPNAAFDFFQGQIPVVKIYNRALTASEVLQNYNATKGRFGL